MRLRLPFRYCEPTFFAGLLDDPLLLVNIRPLGKSLLFDCGQIHHLAKRVLKSVTAIFISHAHMDHFMGMDSFIRHNHVSPRTVDIFGPPGITRKMAAKLASYDWNLTESFWCSFRVHEILADRILTSLFPGAEGFTCRFEGDQPRSDQVIYANSFLQVEAEQCDHKIPVLIYRITERPAFLLDEKKMDGAGLIRGEWLTELKRRYHAAGVAKEPLMVPYRSGNEVVERPVLDSVELYLSIRREETAASIGYVTDIGFSEENQAKTLRFLSGVRLLVCECSFLAEDLEKARVSHHLCSSDLNSLAKMIRPPFLIPMHLSKTYIHRSHLLYEQLEEPPGVTLLRLPDYLTPRPLLACEVPKPTYAKAKN